MENKESTHTKSQGIFITLEAIYETVTNIDTKIDTELKAVNAEITKLKVQLAAQWVVHGILLVSIITFVTNGVAK